MILLITLEMRFPYPEKGVAEAVMASVAPENKGFAEARLEGDTIVFTLSGDSAPTLRATADDLLACVKAAEASLGIATGAEPAEDDE